MSDFVFTGVEVGVFGNSQATAATRAKWKGLPLVLLHGLRFDTRSQTWQLMTLLTNLPLSEDGTQVGPFSFVELAAV